MNVKEQTRLQQKPRTRAYCFITVITAPSRCAGRNPRTRAYCFGNAAPFSAKGLPEPVSPAILKMWVKIDEFFSGDGTMTLRILSRSFTAIVLVGAATSAIAQSATTTRLLSLQNPSPAGAPVTLRAEVDGLGGGAATGTAIFFDGMGQRGLG